MAILALQVRYAVLARAAVHAGRIERPVERPD
jgi:hypothetical protein